MNRASRRQKHKPRQFSKKGFTRVVHIADDGTTSNIPTKQGSALHRRAIRNTKRQKKAAGRKP